MQTVIEPTVVPRIIEIPATRQEKRLNRMIAMVKGGKWQRDYTSLHNKHCALGLISKVVREDAQTPL